MGSHTTVLPGRALTFGISVTYLTLMVLLPLSTLAVGMFEVSWADIAKVATSRRTIAAFRLSLYASAIAALVNGVAGTVIAWVLVRYSFPGRRLVDALVDLPFALPTAVAGIALTSLYAPKGIFGGFLTAMAIRVAFAPLGVIVALIFVGLPFVVRTVQPVLEEIDSELEEAAASLGASRLRALWSVVFPSVLPSVVTGISLAFARGLGEYGSVVFISGNLPLRTEVIPLIIMSRLEQFDQRGATIIASAMLALSFAVLFGINALQNYLAHRGADSALDGSLGGGA